jgi:NAD-dependent deacetylase
MNSALVDEAAHLLRAARNVVVFTGAGVSKESGIPTFRGPDGLYNSKDIAALASREAFQNDPVEVWNMYRWRQKKIAEAQPNPGHIALAEMERFFPGFTLITQNIDDLHERAGTSSMIKLHGDIFKVRCLKDELIFDAREMDIPDEITRDTMPRCPECKTLCRPHIVWFGECLDQYDLQRSVFASASADAFLIVGTSGLVSGGYGFTEYASGNGAVIIEVNPEESALSHLADFSFREPSGEALPKLWGAVKSGS